MLKCFHITRPDGTEVNPFYGRHKNILKCVFEKNVRLKRAQVNKDLIKLFFENFERAANDVPTGNIFNYDETGFHDDPGRKKLIFRKRCCNPERIRNSTKSCYTTMFCGSADENFIPPYIMMKGTQK